jgi:hypothetical protein
MIDFRYHLVSLVSVFLALAVGIALGAGPLKGPIGTALTSEVQALREAKDQLRGELDTAEAGIAHRDDFTAATTPALVADTLTGRAVLIITVPDADRAEVKDLTAGLAAAGATIVGPVEIDSSWTDTGGRTARTDALDRLAADLPAGLGTDATDGDKLGALLARALLVADEPESDPDGAARARILTALTDTGLISADGPVDTPATGAVLIAPGVQEAVAGEAPSPTSGQGLGSTWRDLAEALDHAGAGAVVLGPASSATAGGVISSVRSDSTASEAVSTVDTGSTPMGVIATVLALREQFAGAAGAYGFGDGATAALPGMTS